MAWIVIIFLTLRSLCADVAAAVISCDNSFFVRVASRRNTQMYALWKTGEWKDDNGIIFLSSLWNLRHFVFTEWIFPSFISPLSYFCYSWQASYYWQVDISCLALRYVWKLPKMEAVEVSMTCGWSFFFFLQLKVILCQYKSLKNWISVLFTSRLTLFYYLSRLFYFTVDDEVGWQCEIW